MIGPDEANFVQARDLIGRQVSHLARLVDDLLDVSRITQHKILLRKERLDLVPLVRAAVEDHRALLEGGRLRLQVDLPATPLLVSGDPTRLAQVVGNLLHNASKFTDADGNVSVRLAAAEDMAVLSIRDTGIGIDAALLDHVFEPFSAAGGDISLHSSGQFEFGSRGLGLGLALAKAAVEAHAGRIELRSIVAQGTSVKIVLPQACRPRCP